MTARQLTAKEQLDLLGEVCRRKMPWFDYHNPSHPEDVANTIEMLLREDGTCEYLRHLGKAAAKVHDLIYVPRAKDNEKRTADWMRHYFPQIGFTPDQTEVSAISVEETAILLPVRFQDPKTYLGRFLCDADVYNFARADFLEQNERVRKEIGAPKNRAWYEGTLKLLQLHEFFTDAARHLGHEGKERNIARIEDIIAQYSKAA